MDALPQQPVQRAGLLYLYEIFLQFLHNRVFRHGIYANATFAVE